MDDALSANADQIAYWNSRAGERWADQQARIDALFAPLTAQALAAAAPQRGEAVLDIGCGCGATVLDMAERVGPTGRVIGVDVSAPMLGLARRRVAATGLTTVDLRLADASTHRFGKGGVDLIFSRFGVMFFDDPVAAFRNLRTALTEGGRLAFACWQPMSDNPWFAVPVAAVLPLVGPQPESAPDAPGPFAFASPVRVRGILAAAGFSAIEITPHATAMRLAGPGEIAAATEFLAEVAGAAARMLAEAEPDVRDAGRAAIAQALRPYDGPEGIVLAGAVWHVTARG